MELLPKVLSKQKIARLLYETRSGKINEAELNNRLDSIIGEVYDDGREMGMVEALNYVTNEKDRERLFEGIDQLREEIDNVR